jgi:hypothetical protein
MVVKLFDLKGQLLIDKTVEANDYLVSARKLPNFSLINIYFWKKYAFLVLPFFYFLHQAIFTHHFPNLGTILAKFLILRHMCPIDNS